MPASVSATTSWGLGAAAVASVRHHVTAQATLALPAEILRRSIVAVSAIVHALVHQPDQLDEAVTRIAEGAELDTTLALRATRKVEAEYQAAHQRERAEAA